MKTRLNLKKKQLGKGVKKKRLSNQQVRNYAIFAMEFSFIFVLKQSLKTREQLGYVYIVSIMKTKLCFKT